MCMKKILSLIVLVLFLNNVCMAQLNLCVYTKDGEKTNFVAANVDSISFATLDSASVSPAVVVDEYEFVDLGLSVRWATCNVGAENPYESGDYFAWGELETKDYYDLDNYKWSEGVPGTLQKYCLIDEYGTVDNISQLEPSDDVARVDMKDRWRIPTEEEVKELLRHCSLTWTEKNGVVGCEFRSMINFESIFMPAVGYYSNEEKNVGDYGYYWTSTLETANSDRAMQLVLNKSGENITGGSRIFGLTIRPVLP